LQQLATIFLYRSGSGDRRGGAALNEKLPVVAMVAKIRQQHLESFSQLFFMQEGNVAELHCFDAVQCRVKKRRTSTVTVPIR
jgi:hypothetical protein